MTILPILVFLLVSFLIGAVLPRRWQSWFVLILSIFSLYWLQPALAIRGLDFFLPSVAILLTIAVWAITTSINTKHTPKKAVTGTLVVIGLIIAISLTRYLDQLCCITPTRPPELVGVIIFLSIGTSIALLPYFFPKHNHLLAGAYIFIIIGIFIILKFPPLLNIVSIGLRNLTGQSIELATPQDIVWFGFSFIAFRLLHILFDFRAGKDLAVNSDEVISYTLFYSTLPAGPIDRAQRFIGDLNKADGNIPSQQFDGIQRVIWGLFKKFVLADSLVIIALNSTNATQVTSPYWMWVLLYAYALRIYLDFSGYTDIALGIGKMVGLNLPENFNKPYLKSSLTSFWNSWHITLANWFRAYYFNPLSRGFRQHLPNLPVWLMIFIAQLTTMLLIGLWHGITWNFAIWGAWHGIGLFINNRWSAWFRPRTGQKQIRPMTERGLRLAGWFLTFNYVTLGWVWFALPDPHQSIKVLTKLFGS